MTTNPVDIKKPNMRLSSSYMWYTHTTQDTKIHLFLSYRRFYSCVTQESWILARKKLKLTILTMLTNHKTRELLLSNEIEPNARRTVKSMSQWKDVTENESKQPEQRRGRTRCSWTISKKRRDKSKQTKEERTGSDSGTAGFAIRVGTIHCCERTQVKATRTRKKEERKTESKREGRPNQSEEEVGGAQYTELETEGTTEK